MNKRIKNGLKKASYFSLILAVIFCAGSISSELFAAPAGMMARLSTIDGYADSQKQVVHKALQLGKGYDGRGKLCKNSKSVSLPVMIKKQKGASARVFFNPARDTDILNYKNMLPIYRPVLP